MNHQYIDDHQVVDRYLMGRLTPEEGSDFEQHYLGCSSCLERLEVGEKLQRGLRRAVAQDAAATLFAGRIGLLTRLARSRKTGWMAAVAVAIAVGLPAYLVFRHSAQISGDLDEARLSLAKLEERAADSRGATQSLEQQLAAIQSELAAERRRFEDLELHQPTQASVTPPPRPILGALLNLRVAYLSPVRDAGFAAPVAPYVVHRPSDPGLITLYLELDTPDFESYRMILTQGGEEIARYPGLLPDEREALTLALPSTDFESGEYSARVEGTPAGSEPVFVDRFAFRVAASQ